MHLFLLENKTVEEHHKQMVAVHDMLASSDWCLLLLVIILLLDQRSRGNNPSHYLFHSQNISGLQLQLLDQDGASPSSTEGPV